MLKFNTNFQFLYFFGALTNKPHAFKFRAWELETTKNFNFFDILVEDILIETRGVNVLRILPLSFEFPEYNWLTDRTRFFFDSLKNQRNLEPFLFYNQNLKLQWSVVLSFMGYVLFKLKQDKILLFVNTILKKKNFNKISFGGFNQNNFNTDLKDALALLQLKKQLGGILSVQNVFTASSNNIPFLVSSLKPFVSNVSSFFLLVNLDLRFEIPKLNLFLRQQYKTKTFKIFTIGVRLLGVLKWNFKNLGLSYSVLLNVLEGRHWFNNLILKNKNISYVFLGQNLSFNMQFSKFYEMLSLFTKLFNVKIFKLFSDINSLNTEVLNTRNNLFFFKQQNCKNIILNKKTLILNMSVFGNYTFFDKKNIFSVQMSPFFSSFFVFKESLKLTLPIATFLEREQHTFDFTGKIKKNSKVLSAPFNVKGVNKQKAVYDILNVLNIFVLLLKPKKNILNIFCSNEQKLNSAPFYLKTKTVYSCFSDFFVFNNFICDLYKQDEFSKNSLILSIASNVFYNFSSNY